MINNCAFFKPTAVLILFILAFPATDAEARRGGRGGGSARSSSSYQPPSTSVYSTPAVVTPAPRRTPSLDFIPTPTRPTRSESTSSPTLGSSVSPTALAPVVGAAPLLAAGSASAPTAASATGNRQRLAAAVGIGISGLLFLWFRRRRPSTPPQPLDPLDQLLESIQRRWDSFSEEQKTTIQGLQSAHAKAFLSRNDLKVELEKVI